MVDNNYAKIICKCGKEFQVLKTNIEEDTFDWDEELTSQEYYKHLEECK